MVTTTPARAKRRRMVVMETHRTWTRGHPSATRTPASTRLPPRRRQTILEVDPALPVNGKRVLLLLLLLHLLQPATAAVTVVFSAARTPEHARHPI